MMLKSKPTGKRSPRQIERDLVTYREELQKAEAEADTTKQATALNNLGTIYIDKKNCQKAITHFEQAMNLLENSPPADSISVYGNAASAARGIEDWDKALRYALMAETLGIHHDVKGDLEIMQIAVALVRKAVGAEVFPDRLKAAQESLPEHLHPLVRTEVHLAPIEQSQQKVEKQPGRNDPCPCGSEKKYKKCCGT